MLMPPLEKPQVLGRRWRLGADPEQSSYHLDNSPSDIDADRATQEARQMH